MRTILFLCASKENIKLLQDIGIFLAYIIIYKLKMSSSSWGKWAIKNLLNIDVVVCVMIGLCVLYYLLTSKRKKPQKFAMPTVAEFTIDDTGVYTYKPKKKKPKKKKFKHEEECRRILHKIFGVHFKSVRPDWLKNPATGRSLELDCYNENIPTPLGRSLAIEYDGIQHSQYNKHFHPSGEDEFLYQTQKDRYKDKVCRERGVLLIRIPHTVAFHDLERYLRHELVRYGVQI